MDQSEIVGIRFEPALFMLSLAFSVFSRFRGHPNSLVGRLILLPDSLHGIYIEALTLKHKNIFRHLICAEFSIRRRMWKYVIVHSDYNRLIGSIGGLIKTVILLLVALDYLK